MSDDIGLLLDNNQLPVHHIIAKRQVATHPDTARFRRRNLVPDTLAGYFALELRE